MSDAVTLGLFAFLGTVIGTVVGPWVRHFFDRKRGRDRLRNTRRRPYADWLRAAQALIEGPLEVKYLAPFNDATAVALLYSSQETYAALVDVQTRWGQFLRNVERDPSMLAEEGEDVETPTDEARARLREEMAAVRNLMLADVTRP